MVANRVGRLTVYGWPFGDGWLETQHAQPPTYPAAAIKARGDGAASAMEGVRETWEKKLGKRLKWELSEADQVWRLVDAPDIAPTGRVVRKTF